MTVSTEVDHNEYTGNGVTTSFPYTFRIFDKADLVVQTVDLGENIRVLTLDTDYTITGAGKYNGGNVVLTAPLANGWRISVSRELPVTQETDLRNQGKFFAEVHEDAFDKLTMLIQQCFGGLRLALRRPSFVANFYDAMGYYIRNLRDPSRPQDAATKNYVDSVANTNLNHVLRTPEAIPPLPAIEQRKNKIVAMDDSGNPIMVLPESGSAADVLIELAKPTGAGLIGHGTGTVEDALVSLEETQSKLEDKTGLNAVGRFLKLTELRAAVPVSAGMIVYVASAASVTATEKHYGGGYFQSFDNSTNPATDDGGVVIVPTSGNKAWRRVNFTSYDMCFWGVKPDGVTDNAVAITKATDYAKINHVELAFPSGRVNSSEAFPIHSSMSVKGSGRESSFFAKTTNNKYVVSDDFQVDALVVMLPEVYDPEGFTGETYCFKPKLEGVTFLRDNQNDNNIPYNGIWAGKLAAPIIRDVAVLGAYIGMSGQSWYLFEATSLQFIGIPGKTYAGVSLTNYSVSTGKYRLTGTSLNWNLVSVVSAQFGFLIAGIQYSSLTNCTVENIKPSQGETQAYAFNLINPTSLTLESCGTEEIQGGQILVEMRAEPSFKGSVVITNYIPIGQINPAVPTRFISVDSAGIGSLSVSMIGGDVTRNTLLTNLLPPKASGSNCVVSNVGCWLNEPFVTVAGATYKAL